MNTKKDNNVHEMVCIVRCIFVFFVLIEAFKIIHTLLPAIDPKTNTPTPASETQHHHSHFLSSSFLFKSTSQTKLICFTRVTQSYDSKCDVLVYSVAPGDVKMYINADTL